MIIWHSRQTGNQWARLPKDLALWYHGIQPGGKECTLGNRKRVPDQVALYFLLGYLMYASALAAIGVLAPTAREAAQFTFIVILPLLIPLWLSSAFIEEPNGGLAVFLSLFPLTAPLAMAARLATASVPAWQPAVELVGLTLVAYWFVLVAARLFRADTLLSTASLTWKRIGQELRAGRPHV